MSDNRRQERIWWMDSDFLARQRLDSIPRMVRAANVEFVRRGTGEPLVLLHGTGGSHRVWDPLMPYLVKNRDVIAVDLPGFGRSPALPVNQVTNGAVADCILALLDEIGIDRPHVAGTSLGGHVALELGARGFARSVVAFSPTGFWTAGEARRVRASVRLLRLGAMLNLPLVPLMARSRAGRWLLLGASYRNPAAVSSEATVEAVVSLARCTGLAAVAKGANRERLGGAPATTAAAAEQADPDFLLGLAEVPVTIAFAEYDKFMHGRQAQRAKKALPDAHHVVLSGCGHLATWDNPQEMARLLLDVNVTVSD